MVSPAITEKQQFVDRLNKYVRHKQILANNGDWYKRNSTFMNALTRCNNIVKWAVTQCNSVDFKNIAQTILNNKNYLEAILPKRSNYSYDNAYKTLTDIIQQAQNKLIPNSNT